MESLTREFLEQARSGQSVFLPVVREAYRDLPEDRRLGLELLLTGLDGEVRPYCLALPRFADCSDDERSFVLDFVLAQAFNMLSCLGGRELNLHCTGTAEESGTIFTTLSGAFGLAGGHGPAGVAAYGGVIRVIDRMLGAMLPGEKQRFRLGLAESAPSCSRPGAAPGDGAEDILSRAADGLEGRSYLGMDIGGTDIKVALAVDGRLARLKEYDWNPGLFTSADEFIRPLLVLTRLMSVAAASPGDAGLEEALRRDASLADIEAALAGRPGAPVQFDAIGLSFPDVVVADRIVGGESPKTLGMRVALGDGYDAEFARLTRLAGEFRPWVRGGEAVFIVNDGPMAAFTAGVELARVRPGAVGRGVFAHTLGTDFGTGWVTAEGAIPDIPLEVYSCILDLGSYPERAFPADDVRSINNFNNNLPGTMQKFAGQSGVFRLAQKHLPGRRPDLYRDLLARGFIAEEAANGGTMLAVPTKPRDLRKPFLEHMMELAGGGGNPEVEDIFREIGGALGMAAREIDWLLAPGLKTRTLFGRLVKAPRCFELMREGAARVNPHTVLEAADDNMANTPLMRELAVNAEYTVAQFAQAVGAVYYANSRLRRG